jgi:enoyl-CoA hydratase/carnithine racemase
VNFKEIIVREGEISEIILNRPKKLNALNASMKSELIEALKTLNENDSVKVIVVSGEGGNFSTGQDINETASFSGEDVASWVDGLERLFDAFRNVDKPMIASIEGYAAGAGFQLSLLCDMRICSSTAKLGLPEINVGLPCITGSQILHMLGVPLSKIAEMIMTGDFITGTEGKELGIVNHVVSAGHTHAVAVDIAGQLVKKSSAAQKVHKRWLRSMTEDLFRKSFKFAIEADTEVFNSGEPSKAMDSFLKE